jgi:hypothetical protein
MFHKPPHPFPHFNSNVSSSHHIGLLIGETIHTINRNSSPIQATHDFCFFYTTLTHYHNFPIPWMIKKLCQYHSTHSFSTSKTTHDPTYHLVLDYSPYINVYSLTKHALQLDPLARNIRTAFHTLSNIQHTSQSKKSYHAGPPAQKNQKLKINRIFTLPNPP